MKQMTILAVAALMLAACGKKENEYDATGTFEATETTVCAEQNGVLVKFEVNEGDAVEEGTEVGLVDTTQVWLQLLQLQAAKEAVGSQKPDVEKQLSVTRQQLAKARQEQQRYRELVADGAAPSKMLDDADSQVKVLQRQLDAQLSSLSTNTRSLDKQMEATSAQMNQLRDQLAKCHVVAPVSGAVLEKYVERGEFVTTGKPLMKLADTENMFIRAYVTSAQLQQIKLGNKAVVYADYGDGKKQQYDGVVAWISSRSEFTPKSILTDHERADLVYAVKVAVKSDGYIKIGMYGEVRF
ncbi:MAG: HlyD family efflux transporter periplasmic adaptor subunit [Prevotella sp.]|nr:HlyD family efflux transporter periplasmic adaptor subunit [Prevotella sp.]